MKTQSTPSIWFTATLLLLFTVCLNAQDSPSVVDYTEPDPPSGPITSIEFTETEFDFGIAKEGDIVSRVFTFTNTGDEALIISNARGSCGCTVPMWPKEPIFPGETASITVEFNTKNKKGLQSKRVTLTANTDPAQTFIFINGEVLAKDDEDEINGDLLDLQIAPPINPECFAIYPNPTAEYLKLEMEASSFGKSAIVTIYSKAGELMAKREIQNIEGAIEFSVSHYAAGTYIANVEIANQLPQSKCFVVVD